MRWRFDTPRLTEICRGLALTLVAVSSAGCLLGVAASCHGEDDRVVDAEPPQPDQAALQQQQANRVDLGQQFDAQLGLHHGDRSRPRGGRRNRLQTPIGTADRPGESPASVIVTQAVEKAGDAQMRHIDSVCGLSDSQRRTLRLAIGYDARRLAEEIDATGREYRGVAIDMNDQANHSKFHRMQRDSQWCQQRLQSPLDGDSLFAKALSTTLDADQQARLDAEIESRRGYRWRAILAVVLVKYDDLFGLDQRQHETIEKLLLERRPALKIDRISTPQDHQFEPMIVALVLADVDRERLAGILSERQLKALAPILDQGRAMRTHIEATGLLEKVKQ